MKSYLSKKLISIAAISTLALSSLTISASDVDAKTTTKKNEVKNVIFLIGDGMGNSYTSAYRYLKNSSSNQYVNQTSFDKYLVGQQMTYPEDPEENVTDSASAATAMSAGVKTYNNTIAVDNNKENVTSDVFDEKENKIADSKKITLTLPE